MDKRSGGFCYLNWSSLVRCALVLCNAPKLACCLGFYGSYCGLLLLSLKLINLSKLDQYGVRVRFDRLTPREKDHLCPLAEMGKGNKRSGGVAERLGVKVQTIALLRSSLIKKGMIYSPARGDTAFTASLFDQFMLRTMPGGPLGSWWPAAPEQ